MKGIVVYATKNLILEIIDPSIDALKDAVSRELSIARMELGLRRLTYEDSGAFKTISEDSELIEALNDNKVVHALRDCDPDPEDIYIVPKDVLIELIESFRRSVDMLMTNISERRTCITPYTVDRRGKNASSVVSLNSSWTEVAAVVNREEEIDLSGDVTALSNILEIIEDCFVDTTRTQQMLKLLRILEKSSISGVWDFLIQKLRTQLESVFLIVFSALIEKPSMQPSEMHVKKLINTNIDNGPISVSDFVRQLSAREWVNIVPQKWLFLEGKSRIGQTKLNDREQRASYIANLLVGSNIKKLVLLDGHGRMLFSIFKALENLGHGLANSIEVVLADLDKNSDAWHKNFAPKNTIAYFGNIFDRKESDRTMFYFNFCNLEDDISNPMRLAEFCEQYFVNPLMYDIEVLVSFDCARARYKGKPHYKNPEVWLCAKQYPIAPDDERFEWMHEKSKKGCTAKPYIGKHLITGRENYATLILRRKQHPNEGVELQEEELILFESLSKDSKKYDLNAFVRQQKLEVKNKSSNADLYNSIKIAWSKK